MNKNVSFRKIGKLIHFMPAFACACLCLLATTLFAQDNKLTIRLDKVPLTQAISQIEGESRYLFMLGDGIDANRDATLIRQSNGTYTLQLPIQTVSTVVFNGHLIGLTIGDISYDGEVSGSLEDGTAVLTIKNLPSSVLTGSNISRSLLVTCVIEMDVDLLGETTKTARMCVTVL